MSLAIMYTRESVTYGIDYLSRLVGKPTMWFPNRSDINQAAQSQKQARGLKFWIWKVEELYYPCSENKGADQLRVFVFAYANCWFSHGTAHLFTPDKTFS